MTNFDKLIEGYRNFKAKIWLKERKRWSKLAEGQSPRVMVIACSDSRVDPTQIFGAHPGEIFVVRNVANLVPPYATGGGHHGVSAALEFAVTQLEVKEIIVLGHGFCGGCAAALTRQFDHSNYGEGHFIAQWIDLLDEARQSVRAKYGSNLNREAFADMERESVRVSLHNLRTFPWIKSREDAGDIILRGAFFSIADGELQILDEKTGTFASA